MNEEEYVGQGRISKVLTIEEEEKLANHLKWMSQIGFGYTHSDVQDVVQELLAGVVR